MDDDKKLPDYNIKEGGFLVVMIQKAVKPKEEPKPAPVQPVA